MQGGQNHLQCRLIFVFWMGVDGDPATVIPDGYSPVRTERQLDPTGVAGDGLIHGVIQNLCDQMVQGMFIRATDIHTRTMPDRLKAFQYFNIFGGIAAGILSSGGIE